MPRSGYQPPPIDLREGEVYPARVERLADDEHPAGVTHYEGPVTFRLRTLPKNRVVRHERTVITPVAPDGRTFGEFMYPGNYRNGGDIIEDGYNGVVLLDRWQDPTRPWGEHGPTLREGLEMALDVFAVEHGLTGITFADE